MRKEEEERIKAVKKFAEKVVKKYDGMVKCVVMMGSVARGEFKPKSDIDVFVILEDTTYEIDEKKMEKINEEMERIAKKISEKLSIQPAYTLTEFWDFARSAHPIIYNFIKEGIPVYDTGFFSPVKKLLKMGKIPTTREAIENYMESAPKKLNRAKTVKLLILAEDCYYSMLNTAQAVLMFRGLPPPVPSKVYEKVRRFLVEPGLLEEKYAEWLREIVEIRKKIEHRELLSVKGEFVDTWIDRAEKFVKKMFELLNVLEMVKKQKVLLRTHEVLQKAVVTALRDLKKKPKKGEDLFSVFKREIVEKRLVEPYYLKVWNRIEELKGLAEKKKLTEIPEEEVYQLREDVKRLIYDLAKVLGKKKRKK